MTQAADKLFDDLKAVLPEGPIQEWPAHPFLQLELAAAYQRIGDVQGNVMGANLGNTTEALASYRTALASDGVIVVDLRAGA